MLIMPTQPASSEVDVKHQKHLVEKKHSSCDLWTHGRKKQALFKTWWTSHWFHDLRQPRRDFRLKQALHPPPQRHPRVVICVTIPSLAASVCQLPATSLPQRTRCGRGLMMRRDLPEGQRGLSRVSVPQLQFKLSSPVHIWNQPKQTEKASGRGLFEGKSNRGTPGNTRRGFSPKQHVTNDGECVALLTSWCNFQPQVHRFWINTAQKRQSSTGFLQKRRFYSLFYRSERKTEKDCANKKKLLMHKSDGFNRSCEGKLSATTEIVRKVTEIKLMTNQTSSCLFFFLSPSHFVLCYWSRLYSILVIFRKKKCFHINTSDNLF